MALTKLFQIVNVDKPERAVKTRRTREECETWLDKADYSDYMSDISFTIREVWTNQSASSIEKLVSK